MTTLASLPNEIILDIIEYLRPINEHEPIVGLNGAWKKLSRFRESLRPAIKQANPEASEETVDKTTEKELIVIESPLKAFSVTCSHYYELCKTTIRRDLNLIYRSVLEEPSIRRLQTYQHSLRSIRLLVTEAFASNKPMVEALSCCQNVTSLALYYERQNSLPIGYLVDSVLDLFVNGSLNKLGIYSNEQLELWLAPYIPPKEYPMGPVKLLDAIARSPKASKSIIALDLVIGTMPCETYDLIRTSLISLQSLTVRRAFRHHLPRIWDQPSAERWLDNPNLTRLQLLVCQTAYAPHIPHLVRRFPSLQRLLISTCGQYGDLRTSPPDPDRHTRSDALSKVREPLKEFHTEHMECWEIAAMADIPVLTVIITNTGGQDIVDAFKLDSKSFPSLRCLRLESPCGKNDEDDDCGLASFAYSPDMMAFIRDFCVARGIELRQDAAAVKPLPRHRLVREEDLEHGLAEALSQVSINK